MATTAPAVPSGPAHVAVVSFLAARAAPTGGFWIALAGGVALARVASAAVRGSASARASPRCSRPWRSSARRASASRSPRRPRAPMLGRLEARGWAAFPQILACGVLRLAAQHRHHGVLHLGDRRRPRRLRRHLRRDRPPPRPRGGQRGRAGAHRGRPAGLGGLRQHRAGARLPARLGALGRHGRGRGCASTATMRGRSQSRPERRRRFDPRLSRWRRWRRSWRCWRPRRGRCWRRWRCCWRSRGSSRGRTASRFPTGLLFAAILAGGALIFSLGGGLGLDVALRRASRAALLVLVATWLRGAAGAEGLREVARRVLGRLRRLPSLPEAARGARRDPLRGPPGRGGPRPGGPARGRAQAARAAAGRRARVGGGRVGRGQAGDAGADEQVVEDRGGQARLEQRAVERAAAAGSRGRRRRARPRAPRSGSAVASSVRLAQPNSEAASSSPRTRTASKPAARAWRVEVGRGEGVHVHHLLEPVLLAMRRRCLPSAAARSRPSASARPAPAPARRAWAARRSGPRSATARRRRPPRRPGAARAGTPGRRRPGRAGGAARRGRRRGRSDASANGSSDASQTAVSTLSAELGGRARQRPQHPRRDVGGHRLARRSRRASG